MTTQKSRRYLAIETIRIEYAKYGKETRESMRAYCENRISFNARAEAIKKGLKMFNAKLGINTKE